MPKGFSYTVEKEKLLAYMKLSLEEKLKWLEEVNEFTRLFTTESEKKIREKFRRGEM